MPQLTCIPRLYYLFDISRSMNNTNGVIWPFCKFAAGSTRGEHALEICRACQKLSPNYIHRFFISFQGDLDEQPDHSLTLKQIESKYKNESRPRHRSNIIQRLHNVLRIMKTDAQRRPNTTSRLLIFSDGEDNRSTTTLKESYQQTMTQLRSLGISVVVINFGSTGLDFPDADHYNSDDFPSGNMDRQVTNIIEQSASQTTCNDNISNSSPHFSRNNSRSNIRTLNDIQTSVEESQYQYNPVLVYTS
jgi:hypothetical protein